MGTVPLIRTPAILEDSGLSVPPKPALQMLLGHESFKGKEGHNLS